MKAFLTAEASFLLSSLVILSPVSFFFLIKISLRHEEENVNYLSNYYAKRNEKFPSHVHPTRSGILAERILSCFQEIISGYVMANTKTNAYAVIITYMIAVTNTSTACYNDILRLEKHNLHEWLFKFHLFVFHVFTFNFRSDKSFNFPNLSYLYYIDLPHKLQ